MGVLKNSNVFAPEGASIIFGNYSYDETEQKNQFTRIEQPYEIIITEDGEAEPIPTSSVVMNDDSTTTLDTYLNESVMKSGCFDCSSDNKIRYYLLGLPRDNDTDNGTSVYAQNGIYMTAGGELYATKTHGAVWNDYAEYRASNDTIAPGYCVTSSNNGKVCKTTEKLQCCDGIVSDTFGFSIGETDICKTPLAVAGRVLAYPYDSQESFNAGDVVCAGPEGKVVKMTREEIREWPDRIVGTVSEIPTYETWGSGNVPVNGRIWIKIK